MTDPTFSAAIQAFHDAIAALQVATVRGIVMPADRQALDRLYVQIKDTPGVASPPGENADAHALLKWLVPALGAFRAKQERRRADAASPSEPKRA